MHGSTGGGWKRNAPASPRQLPTQPTSGLDTCLADEVVVRQEGMLPANGCWATRTCARRRRHLARAWSRASLRFVGVEGLQCKGLLDLGHSVAKAFGSKFRAITRPITPGQPGEFTVTRGRST